MPPDIEVINPSATLNEPPYIAQESLMNLGKQSRPSRLTFSKLKADRRRQPNDRSAGHRDEAQRSVPKWLALRLARKTTNHLAEIKYRNRRRPSLNIITKIAQIPLR
jgi:hypothetical protein